MYKSINVHQSGKEEKKVRYNLKSNGISLRGFEGKIFFDKIFLQSIKKKNRVLFLFFLCFVITTTSQIKPRDYFCLWGDKILLYVQGFILLFFLLLFFYSSMEYINEMSYTFNLLFSRLFFTFFLFF